MLKVNGEDIEMKYNLETATDDDTRERAYSNHKYIKPFFESTKIQVPEFKANGEPISFCVKGGRPKFNKYNSITPPDVYDCGFRITAEDVWAKEEDVIKGYCHSILYSSNHKAIDATTFVIEMIAGGGGGTGGGALLAGVGGGAGAYAVIFVDVNKLPRRMVSNFWRSGSIFVIINHNTDSSATVGTGVPNRGDAYAGRNISVIYADPEDLNNYEQGTVILTCTGGGGASGGTPGKGGEIIVSNDLPDGVTVLYSSNGLSAKDGVTSSTLTCVENTISIGFESEGNDYKLSRGGFTGTTAGGGASSGAPSQFGNGGIEGTTGNGYDGGDAGYTAYGAGGGGGHGKAFSQSNGGDGGLPYICAYAWPQTKVLT